MLCRPVMKPDELFESHASGWLSQIVNWNPGTKSPLRPSLEPTAATRHRCIDVELVIVLSL